MKIGIVGYGFMGGAHLAVMQAIAGVEPVAVASRTRPSAEGAVRGNLDLKAGPLPPTIRWTADWRDVVRDPEVDAVDICLPSNMHMQVIQEAFANDKDVLCEKPMALTSAECDAVLEMAKSSDRILMIAQVLRFMFPYQYALQFVRDIGRHNIRSCRLHRSTGFPHWSNWLREDEVSGGAILDLLCHDIDQVLQWFGTPAAVSASSIGPVDTAHAVFHYDNLDVALDGGWLAPETPFAAGFTITTADETLAFADGKLNRSGKEIAQPERDPYRDEIEYFVQCCRLRTPPINCMPQESAQAVYAALLLKRSREQNGRELAWK